MPSQWPITCEDRVALPSSAPVRPWIEHPRRPPRCASLPRRSDGTASSRRARRSFGLRCGVVSHLQTGVGILRAQIPEVVTVLSLPREPHLLRGMPHE